jgi:hypothetical protein
MNNKLLFFSLAITTASLITASVSNKDQSETDYALARVERMTGKYIFLNAEPVADYEIAFTVKVTVWDSSQIAGLDKVSDMILTKALKTAEKEGKEFDALIIKSGQREDLAIKFKK